MPSPSRTIHFCDDLVLEQHRHDASTTVLVTSFKYPSQEHVVVFGIRRARKLLLSDLGRTFFYLEQLNLDFTRERLKVIDEMCAMHGVLRIGQRIVIDGPPKTAPQRLMNLLQAVTAVSTLRFDVPEPLSAAFRISAEKAIRRHVRDAASVKRKWFVRDFDPQGAFAVDYHIEGTEREPRNVFVVTGPGKAMRVAAVSLYLREHKLKHPSLAIVDPAAELDGVPLERLSQTVNEIAFGVTTDDGRLKIKNFLSKKRAA